LVLNDILKNKVAPTFEGAFVFLGLFNNRITRKDNLARMVGYFLYFVFVFK